MSVVKNHLPEQPAATTRRRMILWEGGVKFGGTMATFFLAVRLITHRQDYFPLWPLEGIVLFTWLLTLILTTVIWFAFGCLFGLALWEVMRLLRRYPGKH